VRTIFEDDNPWELLDQLDRPAVFARESGKFREFMFTAARLLAPLLPPAAEEWLHVAERYRHKQASATDLERVRVAAWDFLGKDSCNFESSGVLAVRAVICLLFPDDYDGGRRWFETIHFFLDVSNDAADHQREQSELLRHLFSEYLVDEGRG
jgi:hypothetical protein